MNKIVVIDDEKPIRDSLKGVLEDDGYEVITVDDGINGLRTVREVIPDVVLLDIWMPQKDGIEVLKEIKEELPQIPIIIMSGHGNIETAVKATKMGAYDFIEKPISLDRLTLLVQNAIKYHKLLYENIYLKEQLKSDVEIIAQSPSMKKIIDQLNELAKTDMTVVLVGEEGTGKEFLAKYIHHISDRKNENFIEINTLDENDLDLKNIKEKLDIAINGTVHVKEFTLLSSKTIKLTFYQKVRVILSTSENIEKCIQNNTISPKFIYNLNSVIINVPPLRERREDIKPLLLHFLKKFSAKHGKKLQFTQQSIEILEKYSWPGNIKELKNLVEHMVITTKTSVILHKDLPDYVLRNCQVSSLEEELFQHNLLRQAKRVFEREFIKHKLIEASGNTKKTSEILGISEKNLLKLIHFFNLNDYVR